MTHRRRIGHLVAEHRGLIALVGAGLLIRLLVAWGASDLSLQIVDEQQYHQLSTSLLAGKGFALASGNATSLRPPLYPAFIAGVRAVVGGDGLNAVRFCQLILSLVNVALVYVLGMRLFDRRVALIAAAGVCFYPSLLISNVLLLSEVLFTTFVLLMAVAYVRLTTKPNFLIAIVTGSMLGLAALTRSVLWPFPLVLAPLAFATLHGCVRHRIALAVSILIGYGLVVTPWAIRNTRLQHVFTVVDTMGGMNLRMGNYEYTPDDRMWDAVALQGEKNWSNGFGRDHPEVVIWTEGQKEHWAREQAVAYMRTHPLTTLRRSIIKFADFWGLEREFVAGLSQGLFHLPAWLALVATAAIGASYPIAMLFATAGLFLAAPRNREAHAFLLLLIAFICMVHTVVFGHSRYHLPLMPILVVYGAAAARSASWLRLRDAFALPTATCFVTAGVLVAIWVREVWLVDLARIEQLLRVIA